MRELWYKRPFDVSLALFGFLFFAPLFILFSFLIWKEDHGSIFYKQARLGRGAKIFKMLKFRSMSMDSKEVATCNIAKGDPRIHVTKIGEFLRSSAMDELPQIFNILKGDMSFVGPRPFLPYEAAIVNDKEALDVRSTIRPGLTGLAQVSSDKFISNDDKLKYDLEYIRIQTFWLDIKLIIRSIVVTLNRKWETQWQNNHSTFTPTKK